MMYVGCEVPYFDPSQKRMNLQNQNVHYLLSMLYFQFLVIDHFFREPLLLLQEPTLINIVARI